MITPYCPFPSIYDILRAAQCAYYVWSKSIVTDDEFDALEVAYKTEGGDLPVGSDSLDHYTIAERNLALYFIAKAHR